MLEAIRAANLPEYDLSMKNRVQRQRRRQAPNEVRSRSEERFCAAGGEYDDDDDGDDDGAGGGGGGGVMCKRQSNKNVR